MAWCGIDVWRGVAWLPDVKSGSSAVTGARGHRTHLACSVAVACCAHRVLTTTPDVYVRDKTLVYVQPPPFSNMAKDMGQ